ncbi:MAG: hypothetical protein KBC47_02490 [Candidatus Peribacteraceae bacterium]|nr:hypothetical protein [Candidatus Peribacteraceae bacterium]
MLFQRKVRKADRKNRFVRQLRIEGLERRELLAGCDFYDLSGDHFFSPIDALISINDLHENGSRHSRPMENSGDLLVDVNRDGEITPYDTIRLIEALDGEPGIGPYDVEWCLPGAITIAFDLEDGSDPINPGDNDLSLGKLFMQTDPGEIRDIDALFVGIEGRTATNAPFDVASSIEDVELRDTETGEVFEGTSVATYEGLEIFRFEGIVFLNQIDLEIRLDQEGPAEDGNRIRAHVVTEPSSSDQVINIAGITGPTTEYRLQSGGNLTVTPGGVINGNFHEIVVPSYTVVSKDFGLTDVAVSNEKNVTLWRGEFSAEGADIAFTDMTFIATAGNFVNVQNLSLWLDFTGDGVVDTIAKKGVASLNGKATFSAFVGGSIIAENASALVGELHADVSSSLAADPTLQVNLTSVEAELGSTGAPVEGELLSEPGTLWTFRREGNLTVSEDSTPVRERQVLGGTLSDTLLRIEVRAEYENVDVTYIGIDVLGEARSIDRINLYKVGETQPFAAASIGGAEAGDTFGVHLNNRQFVVDAGSSADILYNSLMKPDSAGAMSGDQFALSVDEVMARGDFSSNEITPTIAQNIVGPTNTVVLAKITSITNVNPDPNGSAIPVGIAGNDFKFSAAAHTNFLNGSNDVVIDQMGATFNAGNVELDATAFRFANKADLSTKSSAYRLERLDGTTITGTKVSGQFRVIFTGLINSGVNTSIDAGTDTTFRVEWKVLNPKLLNSSTSLLQASLQLSDSNWIRWSDGVSTFSTVEYPETVIQGTTYQG